MRTKSTLLAVGGLLVVGSIAPVVLAQDAPPPPATAAPDAAAALWSKNLDQALAQAKESGRLVFVEFTGSDWCPPCKKLEEEVYSKPEFLDTATREFVLVQLDYPQKKPQTPEEVTHNKAVAERFKVDSYPTALVLDAAGKELVRHSGYRAGGPAAFLKFLKDELAVARDPAAVAKREAERLARATTVPDHLKLWRLDWDQALADAKAQGKYVLAFFPAPYHQQIKEAVDAMNQYILKEDFAKYVSANYVPALLGAATEEMEEAWSEEARNANRERMRGHRLRSIMSFAIVDPAKDRSFVTVSAIQQPKDFQLIPALDEALARTKAMQRDLEEAMALPAGPDKAKRLDALIGGREHIRAWATAFKAEAEAIMESDPDGTLNLRPKYALRVATKELHDQLDLAMATKDVAAAMKAIKDFEVKHGITEGSPWQGSTLQYRAQFYGRIGDEEAAKRITEEAQRKLAALEAKEKDAATDDKAPADAAAKPAAPETK